MKRVRTVPTIGSAVAMLIAIVALPATAGARDRNDDRIPDRWERNHGLSLKVNQARKDQDDDALRNRAEFQAEMDPQDADSDDDGIEDGDEGAGTVGSFDPATGKLRIDLWGGDTISGLVTDDTEVECDNGDDDGDDDGDNSGPGKGDDDRESGPSGNSGPSDNSGPGSGDDGHEGDDDEDEVDDERQCSADDLAVGAVVQEAELEISSAGAVFEEIELLG